MEPEELERLPRAIPVFRFVLSAWALVFLGRGTPASVLDGLAAWQTQAEMITARVREAYEE